jgi:hypothetical protein
MFVPSVIFEDRLLLGQLMLFTGSIKQQPNGKTGVQKWQCNEQLWRKKGNCPFALFMWDFMVDNVGIVFIRSDYSATKRAIKRTVNES